MAKRTSTAKKTKSKPTARRSRRRNTASRAPEAAPAAGEQSLVDVLGLGATLDATDAEWSRLCLAG